jgi:uncharacterized protein
VRSYTKFSYKNADYRIYTENLESVTNTIIEQRDILEKFIQDNKNFLTSLLPISSLPEDSPHIARMMQQAGNTADVGPMAAVAGSIAQLAAERGVYFGDRGNINDRGYLNNSEVIVENGGDIFMVLKKELILGIHSGVEALEGKLAFRIKPENTPLGVCSSSSTMGHSLSLGDCNLATVFSKSGALADAAATRACNLVKEKSDIQKTLNEIYAIDGILGLIIIKGDNVGMAGEIPEIISNADPDIMNKITRYGC